MPNLISEDELEKMLSDLIRNIYKYKSIASVPDNILNYFIDQLWSGVVKGFGADIPDVDYNSPDHLMLEALENDVIKFSSAKDAVMNKAMWKELVDDKGILRSFSQFRAAAYTIASEHVHNWLQAEYHLAITSAQAASKWIRIEADSDTLRILEFDAVLDKHTTEICRNFDKIRLPWDHWFWTVYYIPNHYGERSTIRQDDDDSNITDESTIVYPEKIPAMFKVNLAQMKKVFPPDHPYYSNGK